MTEERKRERRRVFTTDEAKFNTQKTVTYILLVIFAAVTVNVLLGGDQSERSTIIQTVINLGVMAVGYWLGSNKAADTIANKAANGGTIVTPAPKEEK